MHVFQQANILFKKDLLVEWRQKNAVLGLLLFAGGTVLIAYLSFYLKTKQLNSITWNALLWIIILFSSINAVGKSFVQEGKNRFYYYYFVAKPEAILLAKLIYNILLSLLVTILTFVLFSILLEVEIGSQALFYSVLLLGAFSFSSTFTIMSGIAAKTGNHATLMTVLSVPVIIPVLILLIKISNHALDGLLIDLIIKDILLLGAINMILITVSFLLFPYLWRS